MSHHECYAPFLMHSPSRLSLLTHPGYAQGASQDRSQHEEGHFHLVRQHWVVLFLNLLPWVCRSWVRRPRRCSYWVQRLKGSGDFGQRSCALTHGVYNNDGLVVECSISSRFCVEFSIIELPFSLDCCSTSVYASIIRSDRSMAAQGSTQVGVWPFGHLLLCTAIRLSFPLYCSCHGFGVRHPTLLSYLWINRSSLFLARAGKCNSS